MFVSPDSALSLWKRQIDSDLFDFANDFVKPSSVAWDIGANVGLFSFAAAAHSGVGGSVLAIEPDLFLVDLLRRSTAVQLQSNAKVECLPVAVSDVLGIAEFNIAQQGRASNFLSSAAGRDTAGGVRSTIQVVTVTLDWLLTRRPPPQVVKIDVEGAEAAVLKGAQKLLSDIRPILLCEVGESARKTVTELLKSQRYAIYDWENRSAGAVDVAAWNTLAIPM